FSPTIRSRMSMLKREIIPRSAVGAVVLPYRPPLALREVRPPAFPMFLALVRLFQALVFDCLVSDHDSQASCLLGKLCRHLVRTKSPSQLRVVSAPSGPQEIHDTAWRLPSGDRCRTSPRANILSFD